MAVLPSARALRLTTGASLAPPKMESALVKALLKCVVPPAVNKAGLARGLQHTSQLVRQTTLAVLHQLLQGLGALMMEVRLKS